MWKQRDGNDECESRPKADDRHRTREATESAGSADQQCNRHLHDNEDGLARSVRRAKLASVARHEGERNDGREQLG